MVGEECQVMITDTWKITKARSYLQSFIPSNSEVNSSSLDTNNNVKITGKFYHCKQKF